jgi:uncharacterized tellurite resistance protein B-like protein
MIDPAVRRNFSTLIAAAFADGLLTEDERLILHRKATEMGVSAREMSEMIAEGEQGRISMGIPTSTREREEMLDVLIDIVCADGRVEASEHNFLAKYASHLRLSLPDLRQKIKARMELRRTRETRTDPQLRQTRTVPPPGSPPPPPPSIGPVPTIGPAPGPPRGGSSPAPAPVGPIRLEAPRLVEPHVGDLPPVTLQLIRQTIAFETEEGALRYVEQTLGVTKEQAEGVIRAVLQAFPDLRRPENPSQTRVRR